VERLPLAEFGQDHWSLFAYIETRVVDYGGVLNRVHMRCINARHPLHTHEGGDASKYPTRLRDNRVIENHDDWDCIDDLVTLGLVENIGTSVNARFRLTSLGTSVASELRKWKSKGGSFGTFIPVSVKSLVAVSA
jgi:hypothetical protein